MGLITKSRSSGSLNIDCMFTFIKKKKLKKKIFKEFEKAQKEKNYLMVDILGKRYLKIK